MCVLGYTEGTDKGEHPMWSWTGAAPHEDVSRQGSAVCTAAAGFAEEGIVDVDVVE